MTPSPFPRYSLLISTLLLAGHLAAETHYVAVDDSGFSPAVLNINVGDTVVWVNYDEYFPHSTTSDLSFLNPNYWTYTFYDFEETYPETFQNPGVFTYHDIVGTGTGTITVSAVTAPEITLEAPRIQAGQFLFDATGLTIGKTNVLEISTNLAQWTAIQTNIANAASMTFTNTAGTGANLFRLLQQQ